MAVSELLLDDPVSFEDELYIQDEIDNEGEDEEMFGNSDIDEGQEVDVQSSIRPVTNETFESYVMSLRGLDKIPVTLSNEGISALVVLIDKIFCSDCEVNEHQRRNMILFGDHTEIERWYKKYASTILDLCDYIKDGTLSVEDKKNFVDMMERAMANNFNGRDAMIYTYKQKFVNNPELRQTLMPTRMADFFKPVREANVKDHQALYRYYLEECGRRGYRKIKDTDILVAPLYTAEDKQYTHHYTVACSMMELVYDAVDPYFDHRTLSNMLTKHPSTPNNIVKHLERCQDRLLPIMNKTRWVFSYQNGVFDAGTDTFYTYVPDPDWDFSTADMEDGIVSAHYIDKIFDYKAYEAAINENNDPYDIPTPNCQKILDTQGFDPDVCRWAYASIGRMIFPVGQFDNWQYFPFFVGPGGTGKSTFLQLVKNFWSPTDTGTLMSEAQKNFSIEHLVDKYAFFCMDADDKLTLAQTTWNQMVSGESVAVQRKFKMALEELWKATGAFAGNSFPSWVDHGGSMSRRFLAFMFPNIVTNTDPNLYKRMLEEIGAFMKKCVACYIQLVEKFREKGIWDAGVLPEFFHITRSKLQAESNPLQAFVFAEEHSLLRPDAVCVWAEFCAKYKQFCKDIGISHKRLNDNLYANVFSAAKISVRTPPTAISEEERADRWHGQETKYLLGIGLVS